MSQFQKSGKSDMFEDWQKLFEFIMIRNDLPEYTLSQLALRNGQDREEIWCAYKGFIYNLNKSKLWRNGRHYEHWAGQDLTEEISDAPHNENVFDKFEIVGKVKKM